MKRNAQRTKDGGGSFSRRSLLEAVRHLVSTPLLLAALCIGCGLNQSTSVLPAPIQANPSSVDIAVSGASAVSLGSSSQYAATVTGLSGVSIVWLVNGVQGGSAAAGTITDTGLYTAPQVMPGTGAATVSAASNADLSVEGIESVSLLNPIAVLTSAAATQIRSSLNYTISVTGSGLTPATTILINAAPVPTTVLSWNSGTATVVVPVGTTSVSVSLATSNPDTVSATTLKVPLTFQAASLLAAGRILDQTSFGPTMASIQNVQNVGLDTYLQQQFTQPTTAMPLMPMTGQLCGTNQWDAGLNAAQCAESQWLQVVVYGADQLRQRVAFALSQVFVISTDPLQGQAVPAYHNMLANDAFSNFSQILKDVTISPAMGEYLDLRNSVKASQGQLANENYAREVMQLFTLGINLLNPDGSLQLDDNGQPIPTYTQNQVEAFARAFTGWTEPLSNGTPPSTINWVRNWNYPMVPLDSFHDTTSKTLLNGMVLPAGQTIEQDMDDALANIFNHPNVGPFIGKQLIQHLVTSTPSLAYIARISAVFADNGSGVRGDMKAVITAILNDPEARAGDTNPDVDGGRLREPALYFTALFRSLGFVEADPTAAMHDLSNLSADLGELPYGAPSVFNFYPTDYVVPGKTLNAPQFGLENNTAYLERLSLADAVVQNNLYQISADFSNTSALGKLAANPGQLTDYLSALFMHGQMPSAMRTEIVNTITPLTSPTQRIRIAIYLTVTSPQYLIIH